MSRLLVMPSKWCTEVHMAIIAMFYGIIVSIYFFDQRKHHTPHIHVRFQDEEAVISIPEGNVLEGSLKANKLRLVQAWVEIHQDELMADWQLASNGETVFRIDPLK
jgi:hypothetical protein